MQMPCLPALLGVWIAAVPSPVRAASFVMDAKAECYDKAVVVDSQLGPSVECDYSVNTTFPLRNIGTTSGSARARIGFRSVGVDLEGVGQLNTQLNTGFGVVLSATAEWDDFFIMDARYPDGTPVPSGTMNISALAQGMIDFYGSNTLLDFSSVELRYQLIVGPVNASFEQIMEFPRSSTNPHYLVDPALALIPWTAGQPVPIMMHVEASLDARLEASGSFEGKVAFGNSLDWLGIVEVSDEEGNPVASFTAISPDTGTDWGAVVPEPSGVALCAFGALALLRRRRR